MMKEIDVCYIKLFLRIDLEKFNRSLLRDGNFQSYREIESTHEFEFDEVRIQDNEYTK